MEMGRLLIDDRTGSAELLPMLPPAVREKATVCRLDYGDAAWMGNGPDGPVAIGVERKAIRDLVNSITTGRLSGHQLVGMQEAYGHSYLVVEGMWRTNPEDGVLEVWGRPPVVTGMGAKLRVKPGWVPLELGSRRFMGKMVDGFLNTLAIMAGVKVWRTSNLRETALWVANVFNWWQKPWDKHRGHVGFDRSGEAPGNANGTVRLVKPNLVSRVAKELAGVGWERALELGKLYGAGDAKGQGLLPLVLADEKELRKIKGIGKKLAASMVGELRGE